MVADDLSKLCIVPSGLPGKVCTLVVEHCLRQKIALSDFCITRADRLHSTQQIGSQRFTSVSAEDASKQLKNLKTKGFTPIAVDFSKPEAALDNVALFCELQLPFVMGTTGFDIEMAKKLVAGSTINAVIAPNMAAPIVALQSLLEEAKQRFPHILAGYHLKVSESHQSTKADRSGTAMNFAKAFQKLGAEIDECDFVSIRNREEQLALGVPEKYLSGHAYHRYEITGQDQSIDIALEHNVRGRAVYVDGAIRAAVALAQHDTFKSPGKVFSMIDIMSWRN